MRIGRSSAFVLGVVAGALLKEGVRRMREAAQRQETQGEYQHTLAFEDNLPESLERREPEPQEGQPRFGGTGAIGFSPAAVTPPTK